MDSTLVEQIRPVLSKQIDVQVKTEGMHHSLFLFIKDQRMGPKRMLRYLRVSKKMNSPRMEGRTKQFYPVSGQWQDLTDIQVAVILAEVVGPIDFSR